MALNELINQIVDVQIRNVTSNTFSRDLNTIMVLAKHDVFTAPELYRTYQDATSMAEDGFDLSSYAYNAVRTIFSQEITPVNVVVGRVSAAGENAEYLTAFNQMLMIPQGWLWLISDLRDVTTQVELAGQVQISDKMYLAANHEATALEPSTATDLASQIKALSYSNTACWYDDALGEVGTPLPNYSEAALLGRCANGTAGTVNFRLKRLVAVTPAASVDSLTKMKTLESKGYTFAANIEQSVRSFGSTKTGSGEWIDAVLAVIWLKTNIRERVFGTIANSEKLPYDTDGEAAIEADVRSVISEGQGLGIVADDTPVSVTTPNILDLTPAQRNTRNLPNVRFSCRLSGSINSTSIRGEVFA